MRSSLSLARAKTRPNCARATELAEFFRPNRVGTTHPSACDRARRAGASATGMRTGSGLRRPAMGIGFRPRQNRGARRALASPQPGERTPKHLRSILHRARAVCDDEVLRRPRTGSPNGVARALAPEESQTPVPGCAAGKAEDTAKLRSPPRPGLHRFGLVVPLDEITHQACTGGPVKEEHLRHREAAFDANLIDLGPATRRVARR